MPLAPKIGIGLMAAALAWWFLYHAQYEGFVFMRLELMCITGTTYERAFYHERLA